MSAVDQYPTNAYFLVDNTSTTYLGSYDLTTDGDLSTVNLRVFNRCTGSYSYTVQLVVSTTQGGAAIASSDVVTFDNAATGQTTSDWLGDVTLSFTPYTLFANDVYFFRLELTGYTRNLETTYLGVWCDWLEPVGTTNSAGARLAIGMLR